MKTAPSGAMWLHETKHDGYRLMVRRTGEGVRIKTRLRLDRRFPLIIEAAERLRATSFVLDGEGVILRQDGAADAAFRLQFCCSGLARCSVAKGGTFMRKIILVVASAVVLGAATTSGALAQGGHGGGMGGGARFGGGHFGGGPHFGGRFGRHGFGRDFDRHFAFRRRFFGPGFGFVTAAGGSDWWDNGWDNGCLSRWEKTPFGWRQRLC